MKWVGLTKKETNQAGHAPAQFSAECLGQECPNWKGRPCDNSIYIWIGAEATTTKDRDLEVPPLEDEAIFVTYERRCRRLGKSTIVGFRIDGYETPFKLESTGLIVHGDSRFTDLDVELFEISHGPEGQRVEELKQVFDGWGQAASG